MAETDPAVLGVQSCGCITLAIALGNGRDGELTRSDEKALMAIVREGGTIVRTTVGEARAMPDFLPGKCLHDPPGWTGSEPCEKCNGTGLCCADEPDPHHCRACDGTGWTAAHV